VASCRSGDSASYIYRAHETMGALQRARHPRIERQERVGNAAHPPTASTRARVRIYASDPPNSFLRFVRARARARAWASRGRRPRERERERERKREREREKSRVIANRGRRRRPPREDNVIVAFIVARGREREREREGETSPILANAPQRLFKRRFVKIGIS